MAATQQDEQMPQEEATNLQTVEEKVPVVTTGEDKKEQADDKENGEEFSYLQRNEFTSEIYKIEVRNLGYFGIGVSCRPTTLYS